MSERSGASPTPPPTTSTSLPSSFSIGYPLPKGPRSPTSAPGRSAWSASVILPVRSIVISSFSATLGEELGVNGASP